VPNKQTHWDACHKLRNLINKKLGKAHTEYLNRLFDNSFAGNRRQFWKYIRSRHKEKCGIPSLSTGGTQYNSPMEKANVLNNYFTSVFTNEDLYTVPNMHGRDIPTMPPISLSTAGIESLLFNLDTTKAPGPDYVPSYVLKHCAHEIAPILDVTFKQSLNSCDLPID